MEKLSTEPGPDVEQIKNEFFADIGSGEAIKEVKKDNPDAVPGGKPAKSRSGFLDKFFTEQFCEFKNNAIASKLADGLDPAGKSLVKEVYATTPEEIEAYTILAEYGCSELMPPEWLDGMENFFKHPASGVLKIEVQKFRMLSKKLEKFKPVPGGKE